MKSVSMRQYLLANKLNRYTIRLKKKVVEMVKCFNFNNNDEMRENYLVENNSYIVHTLI